MTTPYQQYPQGVSDKSKVVAGILGILLGFFGAGRFYTSSAQELPTGGALLILTQPPQH